MDLRHLTSSGSRAHRLERRPGSPRQGVLPRPATVPSSRRLASRALRALRVAQDWVYSFWVRALSASSAESRPSAGRMAALRRHAAALPREATT